MDKPVLSNIAAGSHYSASGLNERFDALANAIAECVGREGVNGDNTLTGNLDANTYSIINLGAPASSNAAARLQDLNDAIEELTNGSITSVPSLQLRTDMASNAVNKGSDLIAVVGTTNTVTEELVRIEAEMDAEDSNINSNVSNVAADLASNVIALQANIDAIVTSVVLPKYIGGLELSWTNINAVTVAIGSTTDTNGAVTMVGSSAIAKNIRSTWAEGTAQGGMASGLTASSGTWYHVFAFAKESGGSYVIDVGFDTSLTAANLAADANVIAAGFTPWYYRRLGSVYYIDGTSGIKKFFQNKDQFVWEAAVIAQENSTYAAPTTATALTVTGGLPTSHQVTASIGMYTYDAGASGSIWKAFIGSPLYTDFDPATTWNYYLLTDTGGSGEWTQFNIPTANGQIRHRWAHSGAGDTNIHTFKFVCYGYTDNR